MYRIEHSDGHFYETKKTLNIQKIIFLSYLCKFDTIIYITAIFNLWNLNSTR